MTVKQIKKKLYSHYFILSYIFQMSKKESHAKNKKSVGARINDAIEKPSMTIPVRRDIMILEVPDGG